MDSKVNELGKSLIHSPVLFFSPLFRSPSLRSKLPLLQLRGLEMRSSSPSGSNAISCIFGWKMFLASLSRPIYSRKLTNKFDKLISNKNAYSLLTLKGARRRMYQRDHDRFKALFPTSVNRYSWNIPTQRDWVPTEKNVNNFIYAHVRKSP